MSTRKTLSIALFFFTALTLTHAGFVNYRSGAAETQERRFRTVAADGNSMLSQMLYLKQSKFAGPELVMGDYGTDHSRRSIWRGLIKSGGRKTGSAVASLSCWSR
jgi:hypothetical protein